ncbi:hypothetical protein BJX99DRAFT_225837 [Aspergillus californicus]
MQNNSLTYSEKAIREGRRLYFGNMPYRAKEHDVTDCFACTVHEITSTDISTDPFNGRNPPYCFVEFATKEEADQAMEDLNGRDFLGRPVKINACTPKDKRGNKWEKSSEFVFDRWNRDDAARHLKGYGETGRRLRVSGLPKPSTQVYMNQKLRDFFKGFRIEAISKTICPHYGSYRAPDAPHYAFVDFGSAEEAEAATTALDGTVGPWGTILTLSKASKNWGGNLILLPRKLER